MSGSLTHASLELVAPGSRWGARPEQALEAPSSSLERWLQARVMTRARSPRSLPGFEPMAARIRARAAELVELNDLERQQERRTLRRTATSGALSDSRMCEVFAHGLMECEALYGLVLHDEQLLAGWKMLGGHLVEMRTGEGKTLAAALPAIAAALCGTPVHVLTANDYLAERDSQWLTPLYRRFGLSVGCVRRDHDRSQRRAAHACHITYSSAQQIVFDYLRDQRIVGDNGHGLSERLHSLVRPRNELPVLRGLCFAIIDEADNVLIDDARLPMVLSELLPPDKTHRSQSAVALTIARSLHADVDFTVATGERTVLLTQPGLRAIRAQAEYLPGVWRFERYRQELVRQALVALYLFHRDQHYFLRDGQLVLIDESTGRATPDRSLRQGLHQMLELKEKCALSGRNDVVASISYQRFFLRYHRVSGMSGTLASCAAELASVYRLPVCLIPPHQGNRLGALPTRVVVSLDEQLSCLVERVREVQASGRPILIGTRSVCLSDLISERLNGAQLAHALLNARQDADEARIIREAGRSGALTVATNMAGRGSDIPLDSAAKAAGGLHVINMELNDSSRIDRQLFGRAGRQGDPGSYECLYCLDDQQLQSQLPGVMLSWLRKSLSRRWPGAQALSRGACLFIQRLTEGRHRREREALSRASGSPMPSLARTE